MASRSLMSGDEGISRTLRYEATMPLGVASYPCEDLSLKVLTLSARPLS